MQLQTTDERMLLNRAVAVTTNITGGLQLYKQLETRDIAQKRLGGCSYNQQQILRDIKTLKIRSPSVNLGGGEGKIIG